MIKPHWTSAEFVETRVLPLLCAFALGVVLAQGAQERRQARELAQAQQQERNARKTAATALALVERYAEACEPLLSMPIESTPLLFTAAPAARSVP